MKSRLRAWMDRGAEWLFPRGACCLCCGDPRRADERYCLCPDCRRELLSLRLREEGFDFPLCYRKEDALKALKALLKGGAGDA